MTTIFYLQASGRHAASQSRALADELITRLRAAHPGARVVERDVSNGLPYPTEQSISASFTPDDQRTPEQRALLATSDQLIDELMSADIMVLAVPMYNFSVPGALKVWIDQVVRSGRTFKFLKGGGYEGLVPNRPTYVVATAGGVPMGSPMDHLTPFLRTLLGFLGITSVEFIYAGGTNTAAAADVMAQARAQIAALKVA
jgi:FMN-dependent NADH-azoreductase